MDLPIGDDFTHRRASTISLDGQTLGKYGFPTYRQMPTYITSPPTSFGVPAHAGHASAANPFATPTTSPFSTAISFTEVPMVWDNGSTNTLLHYLTSPNPAPALVRHISVHLRDPHSKHYWWDIRQVRPWTSFSAKMIASLPDLHALLHVPVPCYQLPIPSRGSLHPETEADLQSLYTSYYTTKLNAALEIAQGSKRHIVMSRSNSATKGGHHEPDFTSNYTDDAARLLFGHGLHRVVGLVKSFDRWNTGMRVEGNHRKVEYLRGLAHLHGTMRDKGCRYGFILTEIELVVVRNGSDRTPHFGYLEVQTIQLADHADPSEVLASQDLLNADEHSTNPPIKLTALMALWYLHMLARDEPLAGQPGWRSEIGAPAEGTRRKCMPKDRWLPEPQMAEKREAKRARGWIWPEEAIGRKELGKRGIKYA